jgi:hypothetical protein
MEKYVEQLIADLQAAHKHERVSEDEPDPCSMREWCDSLLCEIDPATMPIYNGIYDDDGNKIDILSIPTPDLCLTCADYLTDNILCDLARADSIEEGEEFMCYAWKKRKD